MSTEQISTLISLGVQILVLLGVAGLPVAFRYILPRLPQNLQTLVSALATEAVARVQQTSAGLENTEKRNQAVQQIVTNLAVLGIKNVAPDLIETSLESAVYALKRDMASAQNVSQQQVEPAPSIPPSTPAA